MGMTEERSRLLPQPGGVQGLLPVVEGIDDGNREFLTTNATAKASSSCSKYWLVNPRLHRAASPALALCVVISASAWSSRSTASLSRAL